MRWFKRISVGLVALLLLLVGLSFAFHQISLSLNKDKFPPPGQFIEVDGVAMHYVCHGQGTPVIVYESGMGQDSFTAWDKIAKQTAQSNKSCYYDRQGMGWSDGFEGEMTFEDRALHLGHIIDAVSEGKPVVLVSHSVGGIIIRRYSLIFKHKIAGMVMSDSAHPNQHGLSEGGLSPLPESDSLWAKRAATIGLTRIQDMYESWDKLDEPEEARFIEQYSGAKFAHVILNHARVGHYNHPIADFNYDLKGIPLVVLSHDPDAYPKNERFIKLNKMWSVLQQEIAYLSELSRLSVVKGTTHDIIGEKPEAVLEAIKGLLGQIK
ncbi:MAG: alpha/beta hydrolase [Algicola sp.]|nr:alpha/beta hydrolase [Algicola sp.]